MNEPANNSPSGEPAKAEATASNQPPNAEEMPKEILDRLKILRSEADEVKRCFTQFSFQAFAFSSVLLGVIIRYLSELPFVGMAGLLVTFFLLFVTRIGNYKYSTANRDYGFELHIFRCLAYQPLCERTGARQLLMLGWEEAMFAWRIIQPAIYNKIYTRTKWFECSKEHDSNLKYRWWNTNALIGEREKHHPGTYLKHVQNFLHTLALVALLPALYASLHYIQKENKVGWLFLVMILLSAFYGWSMFCRDQAKRQILESGLLSIQASAVVWRCSVVAHFRALEKNKHFRGYTEALNNQAGEIVRDIQSVHEWLEMDGQFPKQRFSCLGTIEEWRKRRENPQPPATPPPSPPLA